MKPKPDESKTVTAQPPRDAHRFYAQVPHYFRTLEGIEVDNRQELSAEGCYRTPKHPGAI